jgi:hypothetical protein
MRTKPSSRGARRRLQRLAQAVGLVALLFLTIGAALEARPLLISGGDATAAPTVTSSRWPRGSYRTDAILVTFSRPVTATDLEQFSLTYLLAQDKLHTPPADGSYRFLIMDGYDPQDKVLLVKNYPLVSSARVEPMPPR